MAALLIAAVLASAAVAGCSPSSDGHATAEPLEPPAQAARLLAEAAQDGDWAGVRTYMDVEEVGLTFARATLERVRTDDETAAAEAAPGAHGGSEFPASAMEETFARRFVEAMKSGVESGSVVAEGTLFSAILEGGIGKTVYEGDDEALVSVTIPEDEGEGSTVKLRMARVGERWMLIAIEGTTDLYETVF